MPSTQSLVDLATQKEQQIQVFTSRGVFLGLWKDAPLLTGLKETINAATSPIRMTLPRSADAYGGANQPGTDNTVTEGNIVKCYVYGPGLPQSGLLRFQGVIDTIAPDISTSGAESVVVTITPYSSVVADHGVVGTLNFSSVDPISMFTYFFSHTDPIVNTTYSSPLTLASGNATSSGTSVTYQVQNQSLKSVFDVIMQMLGPTYFWRPNPDNTVTLKALATTAQHTLVLGQHLSSLSYSIDNSTRKNVVVFVGHGVSATAVGASSAPPSLGGIGERLLFKQDSRITDSATATLLANSLLALYDRPLVRTKAVLVDYRGDRQRGIGIDIEAFHVGDTVTFLDPTGRAAPSLWDQMKWDVATWDFSAGAAFNTISPIVSLQYDFNTITIESGVLQPSQDRALAALQRQLQDFALGT